MLYKVSKMYPFGTIFLFHRFQKLFIIMNYLYLRMYIDGIR
jgi:hypothetical protein